MNMPWTPLVMKYVFAHSCPLQFVVSLTPDVHAQPGSQKSVRLTLRSPIRLLPCHAQTSNIFVPAYSCEPAVYCPDSKVDALSHGRSC